MEDSKCLLFSFKFGFDRIKVLRGSPWTFDQAFLLLTSTDGCVDPLLIALVQQELWIRVRCIPPIFLIPAIGEKIENFLASFVMIEKGLTVIVWEVFPKFGWDYKCLCHSNTVLPYILQLMSHQRCTTLSMNDCLISVCTVLVRPCVGNL